MLRYVAVDAMLITALHCCRRRNAHYAALLPTPYCLLCRIAVGDAMLTTLHYPLRRAAYCAALLPATQCSLRCITHYAVLLNALQRHRYHTLLRCVILLPRVADRLREALRAPV